MARAQPPSMSQVPQKAETPAPSPGSRGHRPVPARQWLPDGGETERPQNAGRMPDHADGRALEPGPAPPDTAVRPAPDSPDTIACRPHRQGNAPQAPSHGGALGSAAPS